MKARKMLITLVAGLGIIAATLFCLPGRETSGNLQAAASKASGSSPLAPATARNQGQSLSNPVSANSITIDENREGWEQAAPYSPSDPAGDNGGIGHIDWITVTMAHNCGSLYVRYETNSGPSILSDGSRYNLLMDVDRNRNTGYRGADLSFSVGADVLVQGNAVFTFNGANQGDWNWKIADNLPVNEKTLSGSKRDIEYKIPLAELAVFDDLSDFDWVLWADHTWGDSAIDISQCDFYPNGAYGGDAGNFNTYTLDPKFSNPERGFFRQTNTHAPYGDMSLSAYQLLAAHPGTATLQCYREFDGITLIHRNFWLGEFSTRAISAAYKTAMQSDFDTARKAGLKIIVRFAYTPAYTDPLVCAGKSSLYDAPKAWMLTHTRQLSDILRANSDVIAAVQSGFIGGWGEWWGSCHFACDTNCNECAEIQSAILDTLPFTRMAQLRTPRYKQCVFNTSLPVSASEAHSGADFSRTGHHNDCFVSSASDCGTYTDTLVEAPYLVSDTLYTVMGGETANFHYAADPAPERLRCVTATKELERFHWSFISLDWYTPTLQTWRDEGCFSQIEQRLGYRFTLLNSTLSEQLMPGQNFTFSMQIKNEGFAAPYNPRAVELTLRRTDGLSYTLALYTPAAKGVTNRLGDPRFWLAGKTYTPNYTISLPLTIPPGNYELFLGLPDPALPHRPEYAIRLADCPWNPSTGLNKLGRTITINRIYLPVILKNSRT